MRGPCGHPVNYSFRRNEWWCWTCRQAEIQATCAHDKGLIPHWAGILGWRHICGRCGLDMPEFTLLDPP